MYYKIAVIDDNPADSEYVSSLAVRWAEKFGHTVGIFAFPSAEAFLFRYEDEQDFDILLLDIEMGEMNGVELAKEVRKRNEKVQMVFITGFPDFISEGYEVSALHYLMKPVSADKLSAVLEKAAANLAKSERTICVTFDRTTDFLPLSKILYVEAQKQYVLLYTDGKVYRTKGSLAEAERQLDEYFYKCQRSYIVNLRYVARIKSDCVVLKNGDEVPISRGMAEAIGKEIIRLF